MKNKKDMVKLLLNDGEEVEISVSEFLGKKISALQRERFNGRSIVDVKFL